MRAFALVTSERCRYEVYIFDRTTSHRRMQLENIQQLFLCNSIWECSLGNVIQHAVCAAFNSTHEEKTIKYKI